MNEKSMLALEQLIARDHGNITGIVIQKNGERLYERNCNGFTAEEPLHVFSVTKSVFSALIGIAVDRGHIKGVHQRVLDFFPEYAVAPGETAIHGVTLAHLLTMTAPFQYDQEPYEAFFRSGNWVRSALDLLGGTPPGRFRYSPVIAAHILAGVLVNATGRSALDFATENLFAPLGIRVPHSVALPTEEAHRAYLANPRPSGWVIDPQGIHTASWGLALTPADMASIGQLYLQGGLWNGRRLLSAEWVRQSTTAHSRWEQMQLSYGYLWWILDGAARSYAAMGDGGNVLYVNTEKQLVISIAALFTPDANDRIGLILEHIEPALA